LNWVWLFWNDAQESWNQQVALWAGRREACKTQGYENIPEF
jgi:hypothetical protein